MPEKNTQSPRDRLAFLANLNGYDIDDFTLTPQERRARERADKEQLYRKAAEILITSTFSDEQRHIVNRVAAFVAVAPEPAMLTRMVTRLGAESSEVRYAIRSLAYGLTDKYRPRHYASDKQSHMPLIEGYRDTVPGAISRPERPVETVVYTATNPLEWALTMPTAYPELQDAVQVVHNLYANDN